MDLKKISIIGKNAKKITNDLIGWDHWLDYDFFYTFLYSSDV